MRKISILILLIATTFSAFSQTDSTKKFDLLHDVCISGDWFIAHRNTKVNNETWENQFILKRSYFTIKKEINNVFSVRYTQDITIDKEGDDAGNVETRMKYLYLKIKPKMDGIISSPYIEVGMVHRPWLTYEQGVNVYRVEGNMPAERNKLFNSAGFGILVGGNIGPKMDKNYLSDVNNSMKGKYLSFAVGIYNGGGYSAFEQNTNKVVEGILNYRPLPNIIPQIQLTHSFNIGKGNSIESPDFQQFLFHGGYFGKRFNISAQYHFGEGDYAGNYVNALDNSIALGNSGYSFFAEYKMQKLPFAIFVRYDHFNVEGSTPSNITREITGLKYSLYKEISLILSASNCDIVADHNLCVDLNLQISF